MLIERQLCRHIAKYVSSKEAIVITGMRRVGKTSILKFFYDKIDSKNKLSLDLENPINQKYFDHDNYEMVVKHLQFLGLDLSKQSYVFLDEIQLLRSLPHVVKYLIDNYHVKFFLTGSVSFYMKNFFTETLAGRKFVFELYPLNFDEFLLFKGINLKIPSKASEITEPIFQTIAAHFAEYMQFGGFPDVVLRSAIEEKKKYLEDIFSSYFQMEVVRLGDFRKNKVIQELILLLMQRVGTKLDISKLSSELGVTRITLNEYISFLEGTFFISLVRPFSKNRDAEIRKAPKVYICDTGIINHFAKIDRSALFENCVYNILKGSGKVNYYQKKTGAEIDFIFDEKVAIDVRVNPIPQDIRKLQYHSKAVDLKDYKLVSGTYFGDPAVAYAFLTV